MLCIATVSLTACKKYLDIKSDSTLAIPNKLEDLRAILDNVGMMNIVGSFNNESADEYLFSDNFLNTQPKNYTDIYVWDRNAENVNDWELLYRTILYANTILDHLKKISAKGQEAEWNNIKGEALFHRSHIFYQLLQMYAKQFDPNTAANDPGIALRLNGDYNNRTVRSSVKQCYDQIIKDLQEAASLLQSNPAYKTRPGQAAAFGLLARVYLQIGDYNNAKNNAESCLQLSNKLIDYNLIDAQSNIPFPLFGSNEEIIFYATSGGGTLLGASYEMINPLFYNSYQENDLRKSCLFYKYDGEGFGFKGSYTASAWPIFQGIARDEIYLIRAECYARLGDKTKAMQDLNTLLKHRWKKNMFVDFTATDLDDALVQTLNERKKELIYRGTRWSDLKRLNKDPRFAVTLRRIVNGQTYTLPQMTQGMLY